MWGGPGWKEGTLLPRCTCPKSRPQRGGFPTPAASLSRLSSALTNYLDLTRDPQVKVRAQFPRSPPPTPRRCCHKFHVVACTSDHPAMDHRSHSLPLSFDHALQPLTQFRKQVDHRFTADDTTQHSWIEEKPIQGGHTLQHLDALRSPEAPRPTVRSLGRFRYVGKIDGIPGHWW